MKSIATRATLCHQALDNPLHGVGSLCFFSLLPVSEFGPSLPSDSPRVSRKYKKWATQQKPEEILALLGVTGALLVGGAPREAGSDSHPRLSITTGPGRPDV